MSRLVSVLASSGAEDDSFHTTSIETPNNSIHLKIAIMQIKKVIYFLNDYCENTITAVFQCSSAFIFLSI